MTNLMTAVLITIGTNWVDIGTFTPSTGNYAFPTHNVQEGHIVTNTWSIFEWRGQKKELLIESQQGPSIGERRVDRYQFYQTNSLHIFNAKDYTLTNQW